MANFYTNSSLTTQLITPIEFTQNIDGSTGDLDATIYFGDPNAALAIYAQSNPGVDNIVISITDSTPGSGPDDLDIKLALTQNGLSSATPGASLTIGTSVLGGVANAKSIWIRMKTPTVIAAGSYTQLGITTNACIKY